MYRCLGWLHLTEKGAKVVRGWLDAGYNYESIESGTYPPMPTGKELVTEE